MFSPENTSDDQLDLGISQHTRLIFFPFVILVAVIQKIRQRLVLGDAGLIDDWSFSLMNMWHLDIALAKSSPKVNTTQNNNCAINVYLHTTIQEKKYYDIKLLLLTSNIFFFKKKNK